MHPEGQLRGGPSGNPPMQETLGWVGAWAVTEVPMILDCDPGHDDAIAIVVAARHAELLGITTVAGNAPLDRTTHNALVVRHLLGIDTPVHSGATRPLVEEPRAAAVRARRQRARRCRPPRPDPPARRDRRRDVHRRDLPAAPGHVARRGRPADQPGARAARRARPRRPRRRHLDHGRWDVRQPVSGRRVQHLGRPGGGGDRLRLGRPARHGRARPDPPADRHACRASTTWRPSTASWRSR